MKLSISFELNITFNFKKLKHKKLIDFRIIEYYLTF